MHERETLRQSVEAEERGQFRWRLLGNFTSEGQRCPRARAQYSLSLEQLIIHLLPVHEERARIVNVRAQQDCRLFKVQVDEQLVVVAGRP